MRTGVALSIDMLVRADAVVIVTDHKSVDYQRVMNHAALVVDTRNETATLTPVRARVRGLANSNNGRYERCSEPR